VNLARLSLGQVALTCVIGDLCNLVNGIRFGVGWCVFVCVCVCSKGSHPLFLIQGNAALQRFQEGKKKNLAQAGQMFTEQT